MLPIRQEMKVRSSPPYRMKLVGLALLSAGFLSSLPLSAQQPKQDALLQWMDRIAQQQLQQREDAIAKIFALAGPEARKRDALSAFSAYDNSSIDTG